MADAKITITDQELSRSAVTYRMELLMLPYITLATAFQHFTPRPGVAGREVMGELGGDIELGPYDAQRKDDSGLDISPRTLETFLGNAVKRFDPNSVAKTVYGSLIAQGEELKNVDIAQQVLYYLTVKLAQSLRAQIWDAKRVDGGSKTSELFNGFDTITAADIAAGNVSEDKGNLIQLADPITQLNACDTLMSIWEKADENLRSIPTKMFVPFDLYNLYNRSYRDSFGAAAYNKEFKKTFLEGTDNLCELVPVSGKKQHKFITLTTQGNAVYGYGNGLADENIAVEKHHEFLLSYIATMYFGVQYQTVSKEFFLVAKQSA